MPVKSRSNNRILPSNARAVDVAKHRIGHIVDTQNRRYDSAFQVQGYEGILYSRRTNGPKCGCTGKLQKALHRLDENGNLTSSSIDSLLTGGEFGILPRGVRPADTPDYVDDIAGGEWSPKVQFGILENKVVTTPNAPNMYQTIDGTTSSIGAPFDRVSSDPDIAGTTTVMPDDGSYYRSGPTASNSLDSLLNLGLDAVGYTDIVCPICFGTHIVGGYNVHGGARIVLDPYTAILNPSDTVEVRENTPTLQLNSGMASWTTILPLGVTGIDALKLWSNTTIVQPQALMLDGVSLARPSDILPFCDGRQHSISVVVDQQSYITHLEIQLNQSDSRKLFDLPKTTKTSLMSLLDSTSNFQIVFSPRVAALRVNDLVAESITGRYLLIADVTPWHTNSGAILGWEASVRVIQPQELHMLLPNRSSIVRPLHRVPGVVDNGSGGNRT
jgi:hypothetical protein